jgi:uncharacterized protein (DUF1778 family)
MNFLVQLFLPEPTLATRNLVSTVDTAGSDCLIWINGTTSTQPTFMAALKQSSHSGVRSMPLSIDDLIPNAKQIQKEAALKEAEKAEEYARVLTAAESEKRALIERLSRPSGKSEEEKVQLASTIIRRAVRNGLTEVQVYRFPNSLCTDRGRAINQQEAGWENTLTGIPKEVFQLWTDYLKPRGYRIGYQIIDYPGGVPGDIAIIIAWGD